MRCAPIVCVAALCTLFAAHVAAAAAQEPGPDSAAVAAEPVATARSAGVGSPGDAASAAQVDALREHLKAAYGRGDVQGMLKYLHPDVTIIFPDGEVLRGRDALVAYYDKMLRAPDAIVESYTSEPAVKERYLHGDTVVSHGLMNDHYVLKDGTKFGLDSRFSVTVLREPDGPPETGGWMIRSFHSSTDAFDNPVLGIAAKKASLYAGGGGLVVGLLAGAGLSFLLRRRRHTAAARPGSRTDVRG